MAGSCEVPNHWGTAANWWAPLFYPRQARAASAQRGGIIGTCPRFYSVGRKNYHFVGSPSGGKSAAIAYPLIETAKLNGIDPQAWLTDVLANIADTKITRLEDLMPWSYAQRN
ncbi:MAG: transposase domain-containing protein [Maricaulis sp.]|nr:transposase domain-containing protein [Maricaulis sp.]MDM7983495.1 transposase domain-containing protein [Maricaulis sp.]